MYPQLTRHASDRPPSRCEARDQFGAVSSTGGGPPETRLAVAAGALVALGGVGVGAYFLVRLAGWRRGAARLRRRRVVVQRGGSRRRPQDLGFPAFATKNTTRVAGADPVADAAGVALAVFPSTGGVEGPAAVTLVDASDWPAGIAAASLMAPPVRRADPDHRHRRDPEPHRRRAASPRPRRAPRTPTDKQIFAIGDAAAPPGLARSGSTGPTRRRSPPRSTGCARSSPAPARAHILLASSEQPRTRCPPPRGRPAPATRCCSSGRTRSPSPRSTRFAATGASPSTRSGRPRRSPTRRSRRSEGRPRA